MGGRELPEGPLQDSSGVWGEHHVYGGASSNFSTWNKFFKTSTVYDFISMYLVVPPQTVSTGNKFSQPVQCMISYPCISWCLLKPFYWEYIFAMPNGMA